MNSYQQKALKSAIANALMNSTNTWEETNLCIAYVHITALNPAFLLDLTDGMPALFLFIKYHNQHPSSTEKNVLFNMLKERTPPDTQYADYSIEEWITKFEIALGPISSS